MAILLRYLPFIVPDAGGGSMTPITSAGLLTPAPRLFVIPSRGAQPPPHSQRHRRHEIAPPDLPARHRLLGARGHFHPQSNQMLKSHEMSGQAMRAAAAHSADLGSETMTEPQQPGGEHERWSRVRIRLRAEVGDDIFSSWFARMDLEGVDGDMVRFSVPTRFLKS